MNPVAPATVNRIPLEASLLAGGIRAFGVSYDRLMPHFFAGEENAVLTELFREPSLENLTQFSPIVFYGPTGSGKTALAYTLQANLEHNNALKKAVQCSALDFSRNLVGAIAADDMQHFRDRIRKASSFLLDGLEDILQKSLAQDELSHVLDQMQDENCPVIVTSAELPQALRGLKKSLASRLTSGLMVAVKYPQQNTIFAALDELLRNRNKSGVSKALLHQFVHQLPSNLPMSTIRGMLIEYLNVTQKGPVAQVDFELFNDNLYEGDPKPPFANLDDDAKLIEEIIRTRDPKVTLKPQHIAKATAKHSGCALADIRGVSRKSQIVTARSLAMYLCRTILSMPLEKIGAYFGGRDHTTVMHAIRKIESRLPEDLSLARTKDDILRDLHQSVG